MEKTSIDEEKFDDVLLVLAQRHTGDVLDFLKKLAGFLRRKTEFFTAVEQQVWENGLLVVFREEAKIALAEREEIKKKREDAYILKKGKEFSEHIAAEKEIESNKKRAEEIFEEREKKSKELLTKSADSVGTATEGSSRNIGSEIGELKPNSGNGCTLDKYKWTQTLQEVEVTVPFNVSFNLRARDFVVTITRDQLTVGIKGQPPVINGTLSAEVVVEDSVWELQDSKNIILTLEKVNKKNWWDRLMTTDSPISTDQINDETTENEELYNRARAAYEKVMFDQRQRDMRLSEWDEQKKMEVLERFKRQHPELELPNF